MMVETIYDIVGDAIYTSSTMADVKERLMKIQYDVLDRKIVCDGILTVQYEGLNVHLEYTSPGSGSSSIRFKIKKRK